MSTYGLQVLDANGVVTFDSTQASGGVCLDIVTIVYPNGGVYTFPDLGTGYTGITMDYTGGSSSGSGTYDEALGYPRFTFQTYDSGTYGLFVK